LKNNKNLWLKKADKLWNEWVSLPGKCAVCGTMSNLERHHVIGKERHLTRCKMMNGILLCSEHHRGSECSPHGNPEKFNEWLEKDNPIQFKWKKENQHLSSMKKPDFEEDYNKLKLLLQTFVSQLI